MAKGQSALMVTMTSEKRKPTGNSTLAIGGVSSPLDNFVVAESSVLRIKFSAEKPAHRQSANRYGQFAGRVCVPNFADD